MLKAPNCKNEKTVVCTKIKDSEGYDPRVLNYELATRSYKSNVVEDGLLVTVENGNDKTRFVITDYVYNGEVRLKIEKLSTANCKIRDGHAIFEYTRDEREAKNGNTYEEHVDCVVPLQTEQDKEIAKLRESVRLLTEKAAAYDKIIAEREQRRAKRNANK